MKRFEYTTVESSDHIYPNDVEHLNRLGAEGWEVIAVERIGPRILLKREVEPWRVP